MLPNVAIRLSVCDAMIQPADDVNLETCHVPQVRFLYNDPKVGRKFLTHLENELSQCERFAMSVAFVTLSGIVPLLPTLEALQARGVKGRILTTDYLLFTEPRALTKLQSFPNIEVRVYQTHQGDHGFHTKGYFFEKHPACSIIIGSSNLTQAALTTNREWNCLCVTQADSEYANELATQFEALWTDPATLGLADFLAPYQARYQKAQAYRHQLMKGGEPALASLWTGLVSEVAAAPFMASNPRGGTEPHEGVDATKVYALPQAPLTPNAMQQTCVARVLEALQNGQRRGLLVSATGSGKTYASAFAIAALMGQKRAQSAQGYRVLFVVHRERIAQQAMKTYQRVLGPSYRYALYSGQNQSDTVFQANFVFATVQMLTKNYRQWGPKDFDFIVMDEIHHGASQSYLRLIDYFEPTYLLGMTATPERGDGQDIFKLFDYQILQEIRLADALQAQLLCPFNYFGIAEVPGLAIEASSSLETLTLDARVDFVMKKATLYGYDGDRVKGLIFCSRLQECEVWSQKLNARGYRTAVVSAQDSDDVRVARIERLVNDRYVATNEHLDYLLSVDILNEGVDIPEVNQVILLRETQSPVVFVQQLGRGLRKSQQKRFVNILDFIGNYQNNYMIPMALSGQKDYTKATLRQMLTKSSELLPGASTIHFDAISRQRIFQAIDKARISTLRVLEQAYLRLVQTLGHVPTLAQFDEFGTVSALQIFAFTKSNYAGQSVKGGSYYSFLKLVEPTYQDDNALKAQGLWVSEDGRRFLDFLARRLGNALRLGEVLVLEAIVKAWPQAPGALREDVKAALSAHMGREPTDHEMRAIAMALTQAFWNAQNDGETNYDIVVPAQSLATTQTPYDYFGSKAPWAVSDTLMTLLAQESSAFRDAIEAFCALMKRHYMRQHPTLYKDTGFQIGQKYRRADVCRLLGWEKNLTGTMFGYWFDEATQTLPVFINYTKDESAIEYHDRFLSPKKLVALTKTKRKADSLDVQRFYKKTPDGQNIRIFLFVQRSKDEKDDKGFYFLGEMQATGSPIEVTLPSQQVACEIVYELEHEVPDDIYRYLTQV